MSRALRDYDRIARLYDAQLPLELVPRAAAAALAAALVDRTGPPAELVVLDRSAEMLARARRRLGPRLRDAGAPPAVAVRADAAELPFPDRAFDLVAMGYLLHLLGRADALPVLTEARRVLRLEGRLLTVTHSPPPTRPGRLYGRAWRVLTDVPRPSHGQWTPGDALALIRRAGLVPERERHVGWGYWSQVVLARAP